jgi:hypothetical protein
LELSVGLVARSDEEQLAKKSGALTARIAAALSHKRLREYFMVTNQKCGTY